MNDVKAGVKTSEFWLSVLAMAMPLISSLQGFPSPWVSLPAAAIAGAYALSRSQAKKAAPILVAPSVLAAQQDAAAQLPAFGAMTKDELNAARAAQGQPPLAAIPTAPLPAPTNK